MTVGELRKHGDHGLGTFNGLDGELIMLEGDINHDSFIKTAQGKLPSQNVFCAIRISGNFEYIKCGGVTRQNRPYDKTLIEILADRPVYEAENVSGTLMEFRATSLEIGHDTKSHYNIVLPDTEEFELAQFRSDPVNY